MTNSPVDNRAARLSICYGMELKVAGRSAGTVRDRGPRTAMITVRGQKTHSRFASAPQTPINTRPPRGQPTPRATHPASNRPRRNPTAPRGTVAVVQPDVLGEPYQQQILDLGRDDEGPVVATLVQRRAEQPSGKAVLYVHGFNDYFFQTHVADFHVARGWDFYALDLRKYGRSLRPYQTPNFVRRLDEYFPELDRAAEIIRTDHDLLFVNAHSTGGLITPLWAHARRADGIVDGMFLNSPFFDLNAAWFMRRPAAAVISGVGRRRPYRIIPLGLSTVYGDSLHAEHKGEWTYDKTWKPVASFPVRAGWLGAIRHAQRQLHAGLAIPVPILVASSAATFRGKAWGPGATQADAVLNVHDMARWAPMLGRHVTMVRFEGGLHDLTLSAAPVREAVFSELDRWLGAFVDVARPAGTAPTPAGGAPADAG